METINFSTEKGCQKWESLKVKEKEAYKKASSLAEYIKTGSPSPLRYNKCFILSVKNRSLIMKDNKIWMDSWVRGKYFNPYHVDDVSIQNVFDRYPEAVIVATANISRHLVCNGDESYEDNNLSDLVKGIVPCVSISFNCLSQFFNSEVSTVAVNKLINGDVVLVDYNADERISLTSAERKKHKSKLKPPQAGFTLVGTSWHRSATVLINDVKREKSYLMGQDEGSYFGCELAEVVKSVKDAYASLMPKELLNCVKYTRQGEWFAKSIAFAEVPKEEDCIICVEGGNNWGDASAKVWASRKNVKGSRHFINTSDKIRVGKDGKIYCENITMEHENGDHNDMIGTGWTVLYENRAIRSFSQEGVD